MDEPEPEHSRMQPRTLPRRRLAPLLSKEEQEQTEGTEIQAETCAGDIGDADFAGAGFGLRGMTING